MIRTENPVMYPGPDDGKEDRTAVDDPLQVMLYQLNTQNQHISRNCLLHICRFNYLPVLEPVVVSQIPHTGTYSQRWARAFNTERPIASQNPLCYPALFSDPSVSAADFTSLNESVGLLLPFLCSPRMIRQQRYHQCCGSGSARIRI